MKRYLCGLVALGFLQGVAGPLKAQPTYSFTTLDVPGSSSWIGTYANGINASGQIVGSVYTDAGYGFLLDNGSYTTLDVPGSIHPQQFNENDGSLGTQAYGINDSGQIVGVYKDAVRDTRLPA